MVVIQRTTAGLKKTKKSTNKIHFKNKTTKEKEFIRQEYYLLFLLVPFSMCFVAAQFREKIRVKKSLRLQST
ncbi:hypothetical protein HQ40_08525 [Porphyromonas gulae]|nr:hypothetical protein HQ40_08525 [Porphyromonas gulae]KGN81311.1 hypothetical protein HR13_01460 [Porphyromonas gulae]KKC50602.1 hypothetical protein HR10_08440 [Porphyromonas gulae]